MQERNTAKVKVLRALIGALDNAEAITVSEGPYRSLAFGDPQSEVARRALDHSAVAAVLVAEVAERVSAAENCGRYGQDDHAARLRAEAALIATYQA